MQSKSFHPPQRTLMGPGPSDVYPRILEAMSRPTIGHLDPVFVAMMDEMKELLRYAFQTRNELTMPVSAPGSAGMETAFVNLVEPGDTVVVCQNGVFGGRMKENVERAGGTAVMVEDAWGEPVDPHKAEAALKKHPETKVLAFVHAETSTGAQSDAKTLAELARRHDCLSIVDTVTSLGGTPLLVDDWGLDAVYSGTQKCLSCVPGLIVGCAGVFANIEGLICRVRSHPFCRIERPCRLHWESSPRRRSRVSMLLIGSAFP